MHICIKGLNLFLRISVNGRQLTHEDGYILIDIHILKHKGRLLTREDGYIYMYTYV